MAYITAEEFLAASTGADTRELRAGVLDDYIERASEDINLYCNRDFTYQSVTEILSTDNAGRARIGRDGSVSLYPVQVYPIITVATVSYLIRSISGAVLAGAVNSPVDASFIRIDKDTFNHGWRVKVFGDFSAYRNPSTVIEFTIEYTGGFQVVPTWLKAATIDWTTGLIKRRGGQGLVMTGTGQMIDMSARDYDIRNAKVRLQPFVREF